MNPRKYAVAQAMICLVSSMALIGITRQATIVFEAYLQSERMVMRVGLYILTIQVLVTILLLLVITTWSEK